MGSRCRPAWSGVATDILAQKYFRKSGVPQYALDGKPLLDREGRPVLGGERDARQVFHRLAGCWMHWGEKYGYFDTPSDARAFYDELCSMLASQVAAPNSPQWFNTGLHYAYGLSGPAQGHYYVDPDTGILTRASSGLRAPPAARLPALPCPGLDPGGPPAHRPDRDQAPGRPRGLRRPDGGHRDDPGGGGAGERREGGLPDRAQERGGGRGHRRPPRVGHRQRGRRLAAGGRGGAGRGAVPVHPDRGPLGLPGVPDGRGRPGGVAAGRRLRGPGRARDRPQPGRRVHDHRQGRDGLRRGAGAPRLRGRPLPRPVDGDRGPRASTSTASASTGSGCARSSRSTACSGRARITRCRP